MNTLKWFKIQIYNRWTPTNKISFWIALVSLTFGIFSYLYPLENFSDTIKISPKKILLAKNNKNYSPIFYVKNNTDEIINQIWLKLTLTSNIISLRNEDIAIKLISDDGRMSLDVPMANTTSKLNLSDYLLCIAGIDSIGKQALFIFRNQLGPKETLKIQIANSFQKRLQGEHSFKITFLNSSDEPVETYINKGGPLEISPASIGEKITMIKFVQIMRSKVIQ